MKFTFLTPEQVEALTPEKRAEYLRKLQEHLQAQTTQQTTVADEVKAMRAQLQQEQQARLAVEMQARVNQLVQQYPTIAVDALSQESMKALEESVPAAVEVGQQRFNMYGQMYYQQVVLPQQEQEAQLAAQQQFQQPAGPSVFGPAAPGGAPNMPRFVDPRLQNPQQFAQPAQRPPQIQPVMGMPYGAQPQYQQPQNFQIPPGYVYDPSTGHIVPAQQVQQQMYGGFPQGQMYGQQPPPQFQPGHHYGNVPPQYQQPFQPQYQQVQQPQGPVATQAQQQQYANAASRRRTGGNDPMAPRGLRGQTIEDPQAQASIQQYRQNYAGQMFDPSTGQPYDHNRQLQVQGTMPQGPAGGYSRQQGFFAHRVAQPQQMQVQWRN